MAKIRTPEGWFHYDRKYLFLGIKRINKDIAFDNLKLFLSIFEQARIKTGPVYGSLLGIVRDNDFITWDEDIDLFILKEDEDKLRSSLRILKENGFFLVRYERIGLYSFMRNGEYIDIYVMTAIGGGLRESGGYFFFEKDFTDTISYDFKGLTIDIPREYEQHLEFNYGDWRTPVQYADFNLSGVQKSISKVKTFIKNNLPDFLFYPMLRRHHRKDLEDFIEKCESKGIQLDFDKIRY